MNILFIYDAPLCPETGGTERATKLVMDELSRRGHNCMGIIHWNQMSPNEQFLNGENIKSIYEFLSANKIDIVVNQIAFHYRFLSQFLSLGGQRWKDEGGKIVSFMHLDPTPAPRKKLKSYFYGWSKKSLLAKIKRIIFISCLPYFNYKTNQEYKFSLRYVYDNSDRYVLMSQSFLDIFVKLTDLKDTKKICIIPNMLTFPEIATEEIFKTKENIVLVVARLDDEQKNISFIINCWKKIKDHKHYNLRILGDGQDKNLLRAKAKDVPDIIFEGKQSPLTWYQRAKISLMASPREGWGLTITESMQNGVIPVVLNTSSVFKDIIEHGKDGFLPDTEDEFISCIERLIENNTLRNIMAVNGLASAKKFSSDSVGIKWESMLNRI